MDTCSSYPGGEGMYLNSPFSSEPPTCLAHHALWGMGWRQRSGVVSRTRIGMAFDLRSRSAGPMTRAATVILGSRSGLRAQAWPRLVQTEGDLRSAREI